MTWAFPKPVRAKKDPRRHRNKPLARRSKKKRRADLLREDEPYLAFVRRLPCCARGMGPCSRRVDPHHGGRRPGTSLKCHDHEAIPLCRRHHRAIERFLDPFRWPREDRFAWVDARIAETQALARAAGVLPSGDERGAASTSRGEAEVRR